MKTACPDSFHQPGCRLSKLRHLASGLDTLFDIALHDQGKPGVFQADLTSYSLGSVLLGHTRSVAQCFPARPPPLPAVALTISSSSFTWWAGITAALARQGLKYRAGDICVLDCAETFDTQASDFENLTLVIPRVLLEAKLPRLEALHGLVLQAGSTWNRILSQHLWCCSSRRHT